MSRSILRSAIKDFILTFAILDLSVRGQSSNAGGFHQLFAEEGAWPWQVGMFRERLDVFSVSYNAAKVITPEEFLFWKTS